MRFMSQWLVAAALAASSATVSAQEFPTKAVKMVVPFSAGGTTDATARVLGSVLEKVWKQPFIVENRPGGSQLVGAEFVKGQAPDGYTMLMYAHSLVGQDLLTKTSFNMLNDMVQLATVAGSGLVLTVPGTHAAKNLRDFVAYAKARPGKVNEGTVGATGVLEIRKLWLDLGLDIQKVPYKGGANTITAIAAGEIDIYGASPLDVVQLSRSGKVVPLAYTETQRHPLFPDLPTAAEVLGMPGYEARYYFGIAAPKGVSPAIVNRINRSVIAAVESPELKDKLDALGLRSYKDSPEQLTASLQRVRVEIQQAIASGIVKPDF